MPANPSSEEAGNNTKERSFENHCKLFEIQEAA
jgi:hypothetical protein